MQSTGSRKGQTSITHLMNFSLPPRPVNYPPANSYNRQSSRKPTWGVGSGYHAVDKARSVRRSNSCPSEAQLIVSDTSTPTIVSLLTHATTTTPKGSTQTFTLTGQIFCRFSFRRSLKPLPVQSV